MEERFSPWSMIYPFEHQRELDHEYDKKAEVFETNPWELTILESICYYYGQVQGIDLLRERAFGIYNAQYPDQCRSAVERCFTMNWIQVISAEYLALVRSELQRGGYQIVGGLVEDGLSDAESIGLITFTGPGRQHFLRWCGDDDSLFYTCDIEENHIFTIYGESIAACYEVFRDHQGEFKLLQDPQQIGRWSSGLHHRFESGFKLRYRCDSYG